MRKDGEKERSKRRVSTATLLITSITFLTQRPTDVVVKTCLTSKSFPNFLEI